MALASPRASKAPRLEDPDELETYAETMLPDYCYDIMQMAKAPTQAAFLLRDDAIQLLERNKVKVGDFAWDSIDFDIPMVDCPKGEYACMFCGEEIINEPVVMVIQTVAGAAHADCTLAWFYWDNQGARKKKKDDAPDLAEWIGFSKQKALVLKAIDDDADMKVLAEKCFEELHAKLEHEFKWA